MSSGWNTIESDAGVFTYLIESLGVKSVQFDELISLDPESLAQLNPIGVIFLFKYPSDEKRGEVPPDGEFDHAALNQLENEQESIWFAPQTIQNACGTQALLSVLMNKAGADGVDIGANLRDFRDYTLALPSDLRGEILAHSDLIRETHNSFARASPFVSDETRLATADDDVYHFIAYASIHDTLYELDGLQPAPIRHGDVGACPPEIFSDSVIPVLQRRIARYPATEIRFNLLAMCEDPRPRAKEMGDEELLAREERKRQDWRWENALRRHNFVGFIGDMMKGVTAEKIEDKTYAQWISDALASMQKRLQSRQNRGESDLGMEVE